MSLWIKRAQTDVQKKSQFMVTMNKTFSIPFEERRSRVGSLSYKTWRWVRFLPWIVAPVAIVGMILESRDIPHEHVFTALHIWLADHGVFRHDSIKAINPAYEHERMAFEAKSNDRKWRFTGGDLLSDRELREFAAMSIERQRHCKE